jgi:hypothetical protein
VLLVSDSTATRRGSKGATNAVATARELLREQLVALSEAFRQAGELEVADILERVEWGLLPGGRQLLANMARETQRTFTEHSEGKAKRGPPMSQRETLFRVMSKGLFGRSTLTPEDFEPFVIAVLKGIAHLDESEGVNAAGVTVENVRRVCASCGYDPASRRAVVKGCFVACGYKRPDNLGNANAKRAGRETRERQESARANKKEGQGP